MEPYPETYLHATRTPWSELPAQVRDWVITTTGPLVGPVRDCVGGMATGAAAVIPGERCSAFVKALDATANPSGGQLYRREAEIAARLPTHPAIPPLLEATTIVADDGATWQVNLLEARSGATPPHPWSAATLDLVLAAWADVRPMLAATPWDGSANVSQTFTGWREIAEDVTDPWHARASRWLDRELAMSLAVDGGDAAVLCHVDLRADNILVDPVTGQVSFLDWAHPGNAAGWVDGALLLADVVGSGASVEGGGGIDVVERFAETDPGVDPELLMALISAVGAFLHVRSGDRRFNPAVPHRGRWAGAMSERILSFIDVH